MKTATYVYCVVASLRKPRAPRKGIGLPATGLVRVLDVDRGLFLVVADAPAQQYAAAALEGRLSDVEWVSKAAVAHEAVVESFSSAPAVLPMKLFTLFHSDERALEHVRRDRARIEALVKRLAHHDEWGVRVMLDRGRALASPARKPTGRPAALSGAGYLSRKKAQRDAAVELANRARDTVADLYDRLAKTARAARRRPAGELPAESGPLLLDAAFLVARRSARAFRGRAAREARSLLKVGYTMTVTGPWPPYTFIQD